MSPTHDIKSKVTDAFMYGENDKHVPDSPNEHPSFIRDVLPTFQPWIMLVSAHLVYFYTGNMLIVPWVTYVGRVVYDYFLLDDEFNIKKTNEKNYENYWPFKMCLYFYIITQAFCWLYYMCLFSTNYQPDHWIFTVKPETTWEFILFIIPACFMAAMATLAGHEMVHYKEGIHKFFGSIPFFLMFYTHFGDEHVRGHHKTVATEEDPVSAPLGRNVYLGSLNSVIFSHNSTWNREIHRIRRTAPKISYVGMLT